MRNFLQSCAGLFVAGGVVAMVGVAGYFTLSLASGGSVLYEMMSLVGILLASAVLVMMGGVASMLCKIDERFERRLEMEAGVLKARAS